MSDTLKQALKTWAIAVLGAGVVGVSLYIGGIDVENQRPESITVDGQTIDFTYTDDTTDENLIIFTSQEGYSDGLSHAEVYVAVVNRSGERQLVELMGYFDGSDRYIDDVSVLTVAERQSTSTEPGNCQSLTGQQILQYEAQGFDRDDYFITETTASGTTPRTFDVCAKVVTTTTSTSTEWVRLPLSLRDVAEVAKEQDWLTDRPAARKAVRSFIANNKTIGFPVGHNETLYYKLIVRYPANDSSSFYLEAVGDKGGYGHLY